MLKSGHSMNTLRDNAAMLSRDGMPRKNALAAAFAAARISYFKRYPNGYLPRHLQRPQGRGNKSDYTANGESIYTMRATLRNNPMFQKRTKFEAEAQAAKLQKQFSGSISRVEKVSIPSLPEAALVVGPLVMVGYQSNRDGAPAVYVHRFRKDARPLLAASHDGRTLLILKGGFRFTERGIVDNPRNRNAE